MIFVECKPDGALVCKLKPEMAQRIEHSGDKAGVLNKLVRREGFRNFENSIGLIDQDPMSTQPKVLKSFSFKREIEDSEIAILYYMHLNNHVLILRPRLEEWILDACHESGVNVADYGLPSSGEKLHEIVNLSLDKFGLLLDELMLKSKRLRDLQECLNAEHF